MHGAPLHSRTFRHRYISPDPCAPPVQSTDSTFGEKLRQQLRTHECFGYDPRIPSLDFTVRHYAGDVLYSCDRFLDKNRDTLSPGAPCSQAWRH